MSLRVVEMDVAEEAGAETSGGSKGTVVLTVGKRTGRGKRVLEVDGAQSLKGARPGGHKGQKEPENREATMTGTHRAASGEREMH